MSKYVEDRTDFYFSNSRMVAEKFGDKTVTYAVFLRRKVVAALDPAVKLITEHYPDVQITRMYNEGDVVPASSKVLEIKGSYTALSELETLWLQKVGVACVSAYNAFIMTTALPEASFMDMHARHATGDDMNTLAAYGAFIGSKAARNANKDVKGFTGSSQTLTAPIFGAEQGMGTTPHALIGYADGNTLKALQMFVEACPKAKAIVALVDFNGKEVTEGLECAEWFYDQQAKGLIPKDRFFGVRLDTHGGRFCEGLDYEKSVAVLEDWMNIEGEFNIVSKVLGERAFHMDTENVLIDKTRKVLFGTGVSAANLIHMRTSLDEAGFAAAQIVASSGFDIFKCEVMGAIDAPIDMVGTGSFLPKTFVETYTTADIIEYDGEKRVKVGREHLYG